MSLSSLGLEQHLERLADLLHPNHPHPGPLLRIEQPTGKDLICPALNAAQLGAGIQVGAVTIMLDPQLAIDGPEQGHTRNIKHSRKVYEERVRGNEGTAATRQSQGLA